MKRWGRERFRTVRGCKREMEKMTERGRRGEANLILVFFFLF